MKISQKQILLFTEEQLTYSQEDSHANHTQAQESDLGKRTSDISGRICSEQFKRLSQPSLWAKMFVDSLIGMGEWSSKKCVLTWKLVGTKYNRYYCQLVPSVRHIEETEYGLLPTPRTADIEGGCVKDVQMENGNYFRTNQEGVRWGVKLRDVVENGLLPTPMAQSRNTSKEQTEERQLKYGGKTRAMYLENFAAMGWLPTPVAGEWRDTGEAVKNQNYLQQNLTRTIAKDNPLWHGENSQLNPQFVAEMMGFPTDWTELPFLNGDKNQSKDMVMP